MEPLSYGFEGRGLIFTDETKFQDGDLMRSTNLLSKWDAVERVGYAESISPDIPKKAVFSSSQFTGSLGNDTSHPSNMSLMDFSRSMHKGDDEKLATSTERKGNQSSSEPSVSAKRARITNAQSQNPTCQVYGCNKDLSSSKDYHKRHKVCDIHSKTAVVVVNGIKQRFCQQCSRFHVLAEFDEGKRSCRKRLAGHNERRRKPHFDSHLGSTYFNISGILPSDFFGQNPYGNFLDSSLSIPEPSVSSNSSRALSLLSAQSQNMSLYSTKLFPETMSRNFTPGSSSSSDQEIQQDELSQVESNGSKNYTSLEGANTVDLIELSLHLQRVEEMKYYGQVKLEDM